MARQKFEKGQHVWVQRPYGSWRNAIVANPDVETKHYSPHTGKGQSITHNVLIYTRLVNGQPTGEEFLVRNSRANIVTEERFAEIAAERKAKEWYDTVARQQQREVSLARYTERATTIIDTVLQVIGQVTGDVAKLTDYLMAEFHLPRFGHTTSKQIAALRAEYREEAEEAKKKIRDAGLPESKPLGQE